MKYGNLNVRGAAVAAVLAIGLAGPAMAAKQNNGPQASLFAVTACALSADGTTLDVAARLTNVSTGTATPNVLSTTFTGLAKTNSGNWSDQQIFDTADGDFTGLVLDYAESHATLNVCRLKELGILDATKGINVNATVNYDSDGDGVLKQIDNMCKDDPATEVIEPEAIKFTAETIAAIDANCF